ncbi:MAG: histidine kinase dimerization/phospho-acceptor domain-containing protein [Aliidongia sp.]
MPDQALGAAGQRSLWWILGGGFLLLTLAGLAARTVSLWIVRPVGRLAEAAAALGRGEPLPVFETGMRELQAVGTALRQTDALLAQHAAERDRAYVELQALAATLEARVAERTAALEGKSVELVKARDAEQAASRAKTGFLAAASHDLRQPLHAAALFAAALGRRVEGEETLRLVASIGEATRTMQGMLDALLDVSRLDGGVMEPYPEWFCIEGMFARLKTEYSSAARAKGLQLDMVAARFGSRRTRRCSKASFAISSRMR